jgi:hypothetical protein
MALKFIIYREKVLQDLQSRNIIAEKNGVYKIMKSSLNPRRSKTFAVNQKTIRKLLEGTKEI